MAVAFQKYHAWIIIKVQTDLSTIIDQVSECQNEN